MRLPLRLGRLLGAAPLLLLAAALPAHAMPVTYTLSGLFSGSLNGLTFSDTPATFTLSGSDTSAVSTTDNAFFFNTAGDATFQLGSAAIARILSPTFGVESEYGAASFQDSVTSFAAGEFNELTSYNVLGEYGSTMGSFVSYGTQAQQTSAGALILTGAKGDVTFTVAAPALAAMPEPNSIVLTTTGLLGAAGALRRRLRLRATA
ncbi:PEP-CTERM sorting domain-containing protein [Terriglobus aquaticus]|uniref:PEP-CTERM sorting domain-containing protein n=1 Tax=Terriglobus aquaticus TaxID=940139 RepID=A0ABW9KLM9_9BACT|nr:PEP-CTERM sorting domain-containing protein [Terriglobus aquaticus]